VLGEYHKYPRTLVEYLILTPLGYHHVWYPYWKPNYWFSFAWELDVKTSFFNFFLKIENRIRFDPLFKLGFHGLTTLIIKVRLEATHSNGSFLQTLEFCIKEFCLFCYSSHIFCFEFWICMFSFAFVWSILILVKVFFSLNFVVFALPCYSSLCLATHLHALLLVFFPSISC